MLQKLNKRLEKMMPLITPTSVVIGVIFASQLHQYAYLIPWIFAFITFSGSLNSNFSSLKATLNHPLPLFLVLGILHVLMPLWALGVGHLTFSGDTLTITGLVLGMVIPTGISSVLWVSIYRGNIPLTLAIILIDTLLSPFIVPFTISMLLGESVEMDIGGMMQGLIWMIVIPSLIGMLLNQATKGKVTERLRPRLSPFAKLGLAVVVMINGAVVAPHLRTIDWKLFAIIMTVFFIAITGYLFAFYLAKIFAGKEDTVIAVTYTAGMRNISAGAVLAVSYFPAAVAVPVVIGMLFQQVLASICGVLMERYFSKK